MNQDFDWLDYLSLLNPPCALKTSIGGLPSVTREDVLASLAGITAFAELMVAARTGQLSAEAVATRSYLNAFVLAFKLDQAIMLGFPVTDFKVVWQEACRDVFRAKLNCPHCEQGYIGRRLCPYCAGTGLQIKTSYYFAKSARVSPKKWARLKVMLPVCHSVIAQALEQVRQQLKFNLSKRLAA